MLFNRGASLLQHVYSNQCKDRSVSFKTYYAGRIQAALDREKKPDPILGTEQTEEYCGPYAARTPARAGRDDVTESILDTDDAGGVAIEPSLPDTLVSKIGDWNFKNKFPDVIDPAKNEALGFFPPGYYAPTFCSSSEEEEEEEEEEEAESITKAYSVAEDQHLGTGLAGMAQDASNNVHYGNAEASKITPASPWGNNSSNKLFPDAKPTPNVTGWEPPKRRAPAPPRTIPPTVNEIIAMYDQGVDKNTGKKVATGWDDFKFDVDLMGRVRCPFTRCK